MLLLTCVEYFGARHTADPQTQKAYPTRTRQEAFVTRLELADAIDRIYAYSQAYKLRYTQLYVEFKLVGVQEIPDLSNERVEKMQMYLVEKLAQTVDEF